VHITPATDGIAVFLNGRSVVRRLENETVWVVTMGAPSKPGRGRTIKETNFENTKVSGQTI